MANYCENTLVIKGEKDKLNIFCEFVGSDFESGFSMEKLYPITDEMRNSCESHEDPEEVFWGTCDDVTNVKSSIYDDKIIIEYYTKWSPNWVFIKELSIMFPDIDFELLYAEAGMWFGGIYYVKNSDDHCFCPPLYQVFFAKEKEEDKFLFTTEEDLAKKYPIWDYVLVPGFDWETIYSVYGYNSTNVKNWDSAKGYVENLYKDFLNETIKETEELMKK